MKISKSKLESRRNKGKLTKDSDFVVRATRRSLLPQHPSSINKPRFLITVPDGYRYRFTITDEILRPQTGMPEKLLCLQHIKFEDGKQEIRARLLHYRKEAEDAGEMGLGTVLYSSCHYPISGRLSGPRRKRVGYEARRESVTDFGFDRLGDARKV